MKRFVLQNAENLDTINEKWRESVQLDDADPLEKADEFLNSQTVCETGMDADEEERADQFHWPPSGYGRFLEASAAGRLVQPPFIGSGATERDDSENGRDFPSLVASDAAEISGKVAAGDARLKNRTVRFSDEDVRLHCEKADSGSFSRFGRKANVMKLVRSNASSVKNAPPILKATICRKLRQSQQQAARAVMTDVQERTNAVAFSQMAAPKIYMNKATILRQKHIRQRLRAEWYKENGGAKKPCPFD